MDECDEAATGGPIEVVKVVALLTIVTKSGRGQGQRQGGLMVKLID